MKLLLVMVVGVVFVYFGHRRWRNRGGEGVESELLRADVLRRVEELDLSKVPLEKVKIP